MMLVRTGNWHHVDYIFPAEDMATQTPVTIGGQSFESAGPLHLMFETFDNGQDRAGGCETSLDDIVVSRYSGSTEAAAAINARTNAGVDILFSETFEGSVVGMPPNGWSGKDGAPHPETATITEDPQQGKVMQFADCNSAGDAFSTKSFSCTRAFPCSVSFLMKGSALSQGFSEAFPGSHTWSATHDTTYMNGQGIHTQTLSSPDWHLVEYVFPLTDNHVHGGAMPIELVHFMVEAVAAAGDCTTSLIDNIVIRRHDSTKQQPFCTTGNSRDCQLRQNFDMCGSKAVSDNGATKQSDCQGFCDAATDISCTGFGYRASDHTCHLYEDSSNCLGTDIQAPEDGMDWYTCATKACATSASLPDSLVGYWPLDGNGADISGHGLAAQATDGEWVAGLYKQAFRCHGASLLMVRL
jgi:hypothetical protein